MWYLLIGSNKFFQSSNVDINVIDTIEIFFN